MNSSLSQDREGLLKKLEYNFESIIAKYDHPFPNDDEIDLNAFHVITDNGRLRNLRAGTTFGCTILASDVQGSDNLSRQESTDSAIGSTNYSDSGDEDTSEGSDTDSDGSGPSHHSTQRKRCWKSNGVERKYPYTYKKYKGNNYYKRHCTEKREKVSLSSYDLDKRVGEVPSILSESIRFVEKVQSLILEGSETSSEDESSGMTSVDEDSDVETFKNSSVKIPLTSTLWRGSGSCVKDINRLGDPKSVMNMTYNIDHSTKVFSSVSEKPNLISPKRSHSEPQDDEFEQSTINLPNSVTKFNVDCKKSHQSEEKLKSTPSKPSVQHPNNDQDLASLNVPKAERSIDIPTTPVYTGVRLQTPRAKLYFNPVLTSPASPGCTTEELLQFLNSPLDVLVQQNNARAALGSSSRKHFFFSPQKIQKIKCNQRRKLHPHYDSREEKSMEVDTAIQNKTPSTPPSRRDCSSIDQMEKDNTSHLLPENHLTSNPSLLVSPFGHLNLRSPNDIKGQRNGYERKDYRQTFNQNLMINNYFKRDRLEKQSDDEVGDNDDDIVPLAVSDDDDTSEKPSVCGINSCVSTHSQVQHMKINKQSVLHMASKNPREQKQFTSSKQQSHASQKSNFRKHNKRDNIAIKVVANSTEEMNQARKDIKADANIHKNDAWWMRDHLKEKKSKTECRKLNNNTTQEIDGMDKHAWIVNKYPDESSIYMDNISNISSLSAIPQSSPVRRLASVLKESTADHTVVQKLCSPHKRLKQDNCCVQKEVSANRGGDTSNNNPSNIRSFTSPTVKTSPPPNIRTSTPRKSRPSSVSKRYHLSRLQDTSSNSENVGKGIGIPDSMEIQKSSKGNTTCIQTSRKQDVSNTTTSKHNLSSSFCCMGSGICNKPFCFNCSFS
ncbi:uncharacterized protein LOC117125200 [Anneissia japonica]|uniref:uncharacterized protein LOC117125200 n=1 Tax=Anneissia japonica TaxID=1529436 RepID=UPI0014258B8E|nr:uncharacterized protein LOC117125200 [Anneissia japonica]